MNIPITIVSGLPRSGTSLMMSMLQAGGMELLVDQKRKADEDNPRGYFEYEKVKRLQKDNSWLHEAEGKVVKVVSTLLGCLPPQYNYRVVFMQRNMSEILESQRQMLFRAQQKSAAGDDKLSEYFSNHLRRIEDWLDKQQNFSVCTISFNSLISCESDQQIDNLSEFLGSALSWKKICSVIDSSLYRKRSGQIGQNLSGEVPPAFIDKMID